MDERGSELKSGLRTFLSVSVSGAVAVAALVHHVLGPTSAIVTGTSILGLCLSPAALAVCILDAVRRRAFLDYAAAFVSFCATAYFWVYVAMLGSPFG